jgi:hypothetical protein
MAENGQIKTVQVTRNKGSPLTLTRVESDIYGYAPSETIRKVATDELEIRGSVSSRQQCSG